MKKHIILSFLFGIAWHARAGRETIPQEILTVSYGTYALLHDLEFDHTAAEQDETLALIYSRIDSLHTMLYHHKDDKPHFGYHKLKQFIEEHQRAVNEQIQTILESK